MLQEAWSCLTGDALAVGVRVQPAVPLTSPLPVARLATGALAAQLLSARLLTGGEARDLVLDGEHIAAAFTSERHYRRVGPAGTIVFAALSRFHRTADGWVRLHASYPHHEQAARAALGPDPAARLLAMTAEEAEDVLVAAGGVAAVVRDPDSWAGSAQGRAVADQPLVSLSQVGSAPPRQRSLVGLRVLDLTRVIAGPVCTRTLASHGADVLRVDSPGLPEDLDTLLETGSGKRRVLLDLALTGDRQRLEELLGQADVVVQGYRPRSLHRFGLAPQELAERHPHLLVGSLSAWGTAGPWAARRGFDSIVQAASGIASVLSAEDGTPGVLPAQALDHGAGHLLAAALMTGLRRQREGGVWQAQVSLAGLAHWLLRAPRETAATSSPPTAAPLVRLGSTYGDVDVVPPVGSPPWTTGLQEVPASAARWLPGPEE